MKFLLWLLFGLVSITVAFRLPGSGPDLWPNVNAAGLAAAAYLTLLMVYTMRKPIPHHARAVGWFVFVVIFAFALFGWRTAFTQSRLERNALRSNGLSLGHGTLRDAMHRSLLKTLDVYYNDTLGHRTLKAVYLQSIPSAAPGSDIFDSLAEPGMGSETGIHNNVFVKALEDSTIVLIGESQLPGISSSFVNFDGRTGRIQQTCVLTAKGLTDVIEN